MTDFVTMARHIYMDRGVAESPGELMRFFVKTPILRFFWSKHLRCTQRILALGRAGTKPAQIVASHMTNGTVDRTRPLCPYPQVAMRDGRGKIDEAASFVCK